MTAGPTSQMPWGGGWGAGGGSRTGKTEATPTSATLHLRREQRQGTKESDNDTEPLWASFFWYHLRSSNLPIWQMCAVVICYYMFNPFSASKFFWVAAFICMITATHVVDILLHLEHLFVWQAHVLAQ